MVNTISKLISKFKNNQYDYSQSKYNEENAKTDFIDKMFILLGWDVSNESGNAERFRDVVKEASVKINGNTKAPDYSFRIGDRQIFFVEAKKPSINIHTNSEASFQLRRYGYSANLSLSILTNFKEFAIYDTKIKPKQNDKASIARLFYCTFTEYEKKWDFINNLLSKDAVYKGKLDDYIRDKKRKKGTSELDKDFLKQINDWREKLAKNIASHNKSISIYDLNYVTQKIIDRIIFLRIAEARGIEPHGTLLNLTVDAVRLQVSSYFWV